MLSVQKMFAVGFSIIKNIITGNVKIIVTAFKIHKNMIRYFSQIIKKVFIS
jgi:hypothetical protein